MFGLRSSRKRKYKKRKSLRKIYKVLDGLRELEN